MRFIPLSIVYQAWLRVKASKESARIDDQSVTDFEASLGHQLVMRAVAHHIKDRWVLLFIFHLLPLIKDRKVWMSFFTTLSIVYQAWLRVKASKESARIDDQSVTDFEASLGHQLVMRAVAHHIKDRWVLLFIFHLLPLIKDRKVWMSFFTTSSCPC